MTVADWERPGENRLDWAYTGAEGTLRFTVDRLERRVFATARAATA